MTYIDDEQTRLANSNYIREAMAAPLLSKDQERALIDSWQDQQDEKALHKLIEAHGRLAVSMASKFRHYGLPMGDLIQEGHIGLMQAAERFERSKDVRFSTYAGWWIRAAIQDYVLRNWSIVRTGSTAAQKSLFFNLRRLRARIQKSTQRDYLDDHDREEIAEELKVSKRDVENMEARLFAQDQSLNATISQDGQEEFQSFLTDDGPSPEEVVIGMKDAQSRSAWLNDALKSLPEREEHIIRERHLGQEVVTLEELGKEFGISKERVRQLEQRAMGRLKEHLNPHIDDTAELWG